MARNSKAKLVTLALITLCSLFISFKAPMELGLDLAGGVDLLYQVKPPEAAQRARDVVADRVDALGVAGSTVLVQGDRADQVRVRVPTADPRLQKHVKDTVGLASMLAFHEVLGVATSRADFDSADGTWAAADAKGRWYLLKRAPELTGEDVAEATVDTGELGTPELRFDLTDAGAGRALAATTRLMGKPLAIVVGGHVQLAPIVEGPIERHGRIVGVDLAEASRAMRLLRAGSLPAELLPLSETTIGPTLGADTVRRGLQACAAGAALVVAFMLATYRRAGVVATAALALNLILQVAALGLMGATLTLPGIAGLALTAGMAVDSNVLVFERIREERRAGKNAKAALSAGYAKVFTALLDSHATSLLTAAILYAFGSGPVKGFAVTLGIGLIANLFTATWASRALQEADPEGTTSALGAPATDLPAPVDSRSLPWRAALACGIAVTLAGLLATAACGLKPGLELTGGTEVVVRVPGALTDGDARQRLGATALADLAPLELHRVHGGDGSTFAVRGRPAPGTADRAAARIAGALEDTPGKARVLGVTAMGSAVGDTARRDTGRALVLSCAGLLLYMWARFELRPGLGALAALVHDTAAVAGALALTGTEVDVGVVAALLTVLGYSLNDSIVILDRLRENRDRARGAPLGALVDLSVRQCLARTLMTGVTVLLCLGAMGLIGPEPLRGFVLTMTVGVVAGTLSTLTIVCPLVASAAPRSIHSAP